MLGQAEEVEAAAERERGLSVCLSVRPSVSLSQRHQGQDKGPAVQTRPRPRPDLLLPRIASHILQRLLPLFEKGRGTTLPARLIASYGACSATIAR